MGAIAMHQRTSSTNADVVVIGGGLAGLIAAANSAAAGAKTILLEPRPPGGRSRSIDVGTGIRFNLGAHAMYPNAALDRCCRELGVVISGERAPSKASYFIREGRLHLAPTGPRSIALTQLLRPRSKMRARHVFAAMSSQSPASNAGLTVTEWISQWDLQPDLEQFLHAVIRLITFADAPDVLSADAALSQWQLGTDGVRYLNGGWQRVVDSLLDRGREVGVEFRFGVRAQSIERLDDRWRVATDSGDLHTGAVILAAGTPAACASVAGKYCWFERLGPPAKASCLSIATNSRVRRNVVLGADVPIYGSVHAPTADLAPEGVSVIEILEYLRPGAGAPASIERLWQHAQHFDIDRVRVIASRHLREMVVSGAIPTAVSGGLQGRAPVASQGTRGLFAAGDWVGPVGMLSDAAAASGREAGRQAAALTATLESAERVC
jgi:FAD dependent oxidoreductase